MKPSIILTAAIAAVAIITPAQAAKRATASVPTDARFKKVLHYFDAVLAQYDADKSGKLDDTERAAWEADVKAGKFPAPPAPTFPLPEALKQYDVNGDGKINPDEARAIRADIAAGKLELPKFDGPLPEALKKFDFDGDGKLNADERLAGGRFLGGLAERQLPCRARQ